MNGIKLPPNDNDAEEAVIGSLLIDGTSIFQIADFLSPADFYFEPNRWLYEAAVTLYQRDEAINQVTLAQELSRQGRLETEVVLDLLTQLRELAYRGIVHFHFYNEPLIDKRIVDFLHGVDFYRQGVVQLCAQIIFQCVGLQQAAVGNLPNRG